MESIYSYKSGRVRQEIGDLQKRMHVLNEQNSPETNDEVTSLLTRQMKLDKVKLLLSDKLGRTII